MDKIVEEKKKLVDPQRGREIALRKICTACICQRRIFGQKIMEETR